MEKLLIEIYLFVCQIYDTRLETCFQRLSNNSEPRFTDQELAATNPQHSRVVELRFFGGLTNEEAAEVMSLSPATVERYWSFARAWLQRELAA